MAGILDSDAWGIDIALDQNGDLAIGPTGDLATYSGPNNLAQALRLRVMTMTGELALHPDYGSHLPELVGAKNLPQFAASAELQNELGTIATDDPRLIRADVTSFAQADTAQLITVRVTAVDGTQIEVNDLANPRVTDVVTPIFNELSTLPLDDVTQSAFFADQPEADDLANADLISQLASDLSP